MSDVRKRKKNEERERIANLRADRWAALDVVWSASKLERVQKCRRVTHTQDGHVQMRSTGGAVGFAGLVTCGSVWACPVCSAKILAVRRLEIRAAVNWAVENGCVVAFGTRTLRHHKGQKLSELWATAQGGQRKVNQNSTVRRKRDALGQIGCVRAFEVTHGSNGWHPHVHELRIFPAGTTQAQLDDLTDSEFAVWSRHAQASGLSTPARERTELSIVKNPDNAMADYFAKNVYDPRASSKLGEKMGHEMTSTVSKTGRRKTSRTPWQILHSIRETGDVDDVELWNEYEAASKGKRAITWSRGLKDLIGVDEIEDEEITDEEIGTVEDAVITITDWSTVRDAKVAGQMLTVFQCAGVAAALAFCAEHGIPAVRAVDDGA